MKEAHLHLSATEIQLYSVLAPRRKLDLSFGANHSMTLPVIVIQGHMWY